ncbi:uncharacterized protein ACNLHF_025646 [Anomaloglossus baeobatrachus]
MSADAIDWTGSSASVGPVYLTPEEKLRRLSICMMLLPSPIFKKERLMPTSPEAQKIYRVRREKQPEPPRTIDVRGKRKRQEEYEKKKVWRELCAYLDEEEEEDIPKKSVKKIKLDIHIPARRRQERRIQEDNNRQYINWFLRGRRNIIWTILLGPQRWRW